MKRTLRTLGCALALASVFAVAECLVRAVRSANQLTFEQLSLATFLNVAVLGTIALTLVASCLLVDCVVRFPKRASYVSDPAWKADRSQREPEARPIVLAIVAAVVTLGTGGLGFAEASQAWLWGLSLLAGMVTGFVIWRSTRSRRRSGGGLALVSATMMWAGCVVASLNAAQQTHRYVLAWATVDGDDVAPTALSDCPPNSPGFPEKTAGVRAASLSPPSGGALPSSAASESRDDVSETGIAAAPNVLLIVLDTLRADRVGVYGGGPLTPRLDELAASSIVYTLAFSNAPWTLPTHASLFTGLYPELHGVNWAHYRLEEGSPLLAELFAGRGYDTFAISNNKLLNAENGFARGFADFIETTKDPVVGRWKLALRCGALRRLAPLIGLPDEAGFDAGAALTNWLVEQRLQRRAATRPYFGFINYFEPHDPYDPVPSYRAKLLTASERRQFKRLRQDYERMAAQACGAHRTYDPGDIALLSRLYDAEVAYQDERLGDLLDLVASYGLDENTWIIVTSDHGELFGEGPGLHHVAGVHYALLHVPLILRPPGGVSPQRVKAIVQPVDIFATLVGVAGAAMPGQVTRAYPLPLAQTEPAPRRIAIAQALGASIGSLSIAQRVNSQGDYSQWFSRMDSVFDGRFVLELAGGQPHRLYDVVADPAMREDLLERKGDIAVVLQSSYREWQNSRTDGEETCRFATR